MEQDIRQAILDEEHLRLLSFFYYVSAGVTALFACIPIMHMLMGIMIIVVGESFGSDNGEVPTDFFGWFMVAIGGILVFGGWLIAFLKFLVARNINRRQHHVFCLIIAGISCMFIPYGTILGVMTLTVLLRKSVKPMFSPNQTLEASVAGAQQPKG